MKTNSETSRFIRVRMPTRLLLLATILASPPQQASAQEKTEPSVPMGFICIANTIAAGTGNTKAIIDGKDVFPRGYETGAVTGGIGVKPGGHSVTFRREGVEDGTTRISVEKDQTLTVIPYAELVPATDQKKAHYEIRILRLKQKEIQDYRGASFVSVSRQPEIAAELGEPGGKWRKVSVKRFGTAEAEIGYIRGYAPVRVNGKDMEPIPVGGPGNYVIVLFDDAEGNIKSLSFCDFKYLSAD